VTLLEFGELRASTTAAEVHLRATLSDRRGRVLLQRTFYGLRSVPAGEPAALARTLGANLAAQLTALAEAVEEALDTHGADRTELR